MNVVSYTYAAGHCSPITTLLAANARLTACCLTPNRNPTSLRFNPPT